jgi:hypothetical protein
VTDLDTSQRPVGFKAFPVFPILTIFISFTPLKAVINGTIRSISNQYMVNTSAFLMKNENLEDVPGIIEQVLEAEVCSIEGEFEDILDQ